MKKKKRKRKIIFEVFLVISTGAFACYVLLFGIVHQEKLSNKINVAGLPAKEDHPDRFQKDKIYYDIVDETVQIYLPQKNEQYIRYTLDPYVQESAWVNVFQIEKVDLVAYDNFQMNQVYTMSKDENWELALLEEGAEFFVGGKSYGSEEDLMINLAIDGNSIALPSEKRISGYADEILVSTKSKVYRDRSLVNEREQIVTHIKSYTFSPENLILHQTLIPTEKIVLNKSYVGMLPILRVTKKSGDRFHLSNIIQTHAADYYTLTENFVSAYEQTDTGVIVGTESGFFGRITQIKKTLDEETYFSATSSEYVNKLYLSFNNTYRELNANENIEVETKYELRIE